MPITKKVITLSVSDNSIIAKDSSNNAVSTVGISGESKITQFKYTVPTEFANATVNLYVNSDNGYTDIATATDGEIDLDIKYELLFKSSELRAYIEFIESDTIMLTKEIVFSVYNNLSSTKVEIKPIVQKFSVQLQMLYSDLLIKYHNIMSDIVTKIDNTFNEKFGKYTLGTGSTNTNKIDHAIYSDTSGISTNSTTASTSNGASGNLRTEIDTIKSNATTLSGNVSTLSSDLTTLSGTVSSNTSEISRVKSSEKFMFTDYSTQTALYDSSTANINQTFTANSDCFIQAVIQNQNTAGEKFIRLSINSKVVFEYSGDTTRYTYAWSPIFIIKTDDVVVAQIQGGTDAKRKIYKYNAIS